MAATVIARTATSTTKELTRSLTFKKSANYGVDSTIALKDANTAADTTKLTVNLGLKAGQKYSFSFYYASGGPTVSLIDSTGKKTAVSMSQGFTVAKSGNYQLTFEESSFLQSSIANLSINAISLLPKSSGDTRIDALVLGGTNYWWHPADAVVSKGTNQVTPTATSLDTGSSANALTFSFLSTAQGSTMDTHGFMAMTTEQKNAVRQALAYYSKIINVSFTEVAGNGTGNLNFGTNNQNGISAAYAYYPNSSSTPGKTTMFLANDQWTSSGQQLQAGGYGWETILHEIGHNLGLKHPGNYNAGGGGTPGPYLPASEDNRQHTIMSYNDNSASLGVNPTTAMVDDIAALQYLYGANKSGSTATNGAFSFTAGKNSLETLWSTNGTDTIDLSKLAKPSAVDLNAGSYSSINITAATSSTYYSGNNNVGIAYGAAINNVKLSSTKGVAETVTLNNAYTTGAYDRIASFDAKDDKIALKTSLFGSLGSSNIEFGSAATKSTSKIVVNRTTGEVFYDADGNGKGLAKKIAQYTVATGSAQLTATNFSFVA